MPGPLVIDVVSVDQFDHRVVAEGPVVVVEPLYGGVAVAAALDAGWSSAEVALEEPGAAPIPLVSYDQPPPAEHREGGRCRVRATDLFDAVDLVLDEALVPAGAVAEVLVGCSVNARPLASALARATE